jgi:hypothetical protein
MKRWAARAGLVVAAFLLLSQLAAVIAAPLSIPTLIYMWRQDPSLRWRIFAATIMLLTVVEVGWVATYLAVGEEQPIIWAAPLVLASISLIGLARFRHGSTRHLRRLPR